MPSKYIREYIEKFTAVLQLIKEREFEQFIHALEGAYERNATIFVFGNGGSGVNASHFVADFNKGVRYKKDKRFKVICLNDNMPIISAYANDLSYNDIFIEQLKNLMTKDDMVIGISGSGNSENVLKAIRYANTKGATTFGLCGYGGGALKDTVQKSLVVNSDDMQKVEDAHAVVLHCAMQWFMNK
ncbi:MAG: SIS domain-containing protein [Candidatus Omnitrophica bacterium]|nr:SIS domain-containing protein [Candidatus Omnitrophota bacterium]